MLWSWDADDILFDTWTPLLTWHNIHYGTKIKYHDQRTFDLATVWGCSQEEGDRRFKEFWTSPLAYKIPPRKEAQHVIAQLSADEHIINTSRPLYTLELSLASLNEHYAGVFTGVHFSRHLTVSHSDGLSKAQICRNVEAQAHVDDCWEYASDCANDGTPAFLLDRPWNQEPEPPGVIRIYSLLDIPHFVKPRAAQLF